MSLRTAVWDRLSAIAALKGYGLYPDAIPQATPDRDSYPAIVFVFKNIRGLYDLDGIVNVHNGTITFSVFSYNKNDCQAGIEAVNGSFDGFTGPMAAPDAGISVRNVMKLLEGTDREYIAPDGSSKVLYEMAQKYSIDYGDA